MIHSHSSRITFGCLSFFLTLSIIALNGIYNTTSTFAHSATITTNSDVVLNISPAGDGTNIQSESINITTTCKAGYNLSIATPTGSSLYLDNNGTLDSTATFTAVDGTSALSSNNNTNKWGFTLSSDPTSSTIFSPLSATATTLKTTTQTASESDINDTFNINYGIKVDNTVTPGNYKMADNGSIVYYLTMAESCNIVDIAYDGNNADAGTMGAVGTGVIHTGVKGGDNISLIASNFSRDGYGFAGWSFDQNAGTKLIDNDNTNNPVVYGPQETITIPTGITAYDTDNDGIVKLYAVWIESQGDLQGWMGCNDLDTTTYDATTGALDLTKNSITALTDVRDHDTYAVARLADGKCWMIENLRLDAEATRGNNQYDPSVTNEWLAQGYGKSDIYGDFVGLAESEAPWNNNNTSANSLYSMNGEGGTIGIGTSNAVNRFPRYNYDNTNSRASNPTTNSVAMYSYGNYYTWAAAIADVASHDGYQMVADTSVCPRGWHLPQGSSLSYGGNGEFWQLSLEIMGAAPPSSSISYTNSQTNLAGKTATAAFKSYPNNYVSSGEVISSSIDARGSYGAYWSSHTAGSTGTRNMYFTYNQTYPGTIGGSRYNAKSVRCIASDADNYTLSYNANSGSGAPSSQGPIYANDGAEFTVSNTSPTRSGYTFAGWTDEKGNEVQPGGTFKTKDTDVTLYAIWTNNSCNPTATTIGAGNSSTDAVCLQDVTPSMKAGLPTADAATGTYTLIDARDNQSYTVAKLSDGELWMTKNLNYGGSSDTILTSYDTDLQDNTTFKLPASDTVSYTDTTNLAKVRLTNNGGTTDNGAYYTWAAAVANTNSISTNPTTSICPKGWDLPSNSHYTNLSSKSSYSSSNRTDSAPSSFLINGGFTDGASFYQTGYSHFWTGTSNSTTAAYGVRVNSTSMTTSSSTSATYGGNKYYRKNIRCIASNGTITINYDGNGTTEYPVTGTTDSQTDVEINSTNTMANGFARTGWAFNGWNTQADGSGIAIAAGAAIASLNPTLDSTITLYAQWLPQYTITYANNCQTYASADSSCTQTVSDGTNEQKINLANNPSTGTETSTLAAYNKWALTGWKIAGWTTNADGSGTEYTVSSTYTVPAGSGVGDGITLYAHWIPVYSIQYDGNNADNPNGMGTTDQNTGVKTVKQTNVSEGDPVTLLASNFKKAGYGFAGWSTDPDAWTHFMDNNNTNDPIIYGPMETISAPAYPTNGTNIITLYAVWVPAEKDGNNKPVYLQDFTTSDCNALTKADFESSTGVITPGSVIALTDKRDNEVYTVAKLADSNCWMVENLRLEHEGTVGNNINDSSVTNQSLSQGYGGTTGTYGNFVGLAAPESANFGNTTSLSFADGGIYKSDDSGDVFNSINSILEDIGTSNYPGYRFPRYNSNNSKSLVDSIIYTQNYANASMPSESGTNYRTGSNLYSYGNYYTWAAAMANTNYYNDDPSTSEAANTSICPSNWHLPSSNGIAKEYDTLSTGYGGTGSNQIGTARSGDIMSNRFRSFPNNFLYSGNFDSWYASSRGMHGYYWSRSVSSYYDSHVLTLNSTGFSPSGGFQKYYGSSVRCLIGS